MKNYKNNDNDKPKLSENSDKDQVKNGHPDKDNEEKEKENEKKQETEPIQEIKYTKAQYIQALSYRFEFIAGLLNILCEMHKVINMLPIHDEVKIETEQKAVENENENTNQSSSNTNNNNNTNTKKQPYKSPNKSPTKNNQNQGKKNQNASNRGKKGKGKGGKGKGKQKGKGYHHTQNQKKKGGGNQNKNKKQHKGPQTAKQNKDKDGMNAMMFIVDYDDNIKVSTIMTEKLNLHKSQIQNFKPLSSTLLELNHYQIQNQWVLKVINYQDLMIELEIINQFMRHEDNVYQLEKSVLNYLINGVRH